MLAGSFLQILSSLRLENTDTHTDTPLWFLRNRRFESQKIPVKTKLGTTEMYANTELARMSFERVSWWGYPQYSYDKIVYVLLLLFLSRTLIESLALISLFIDAKTWRTSVAQCFGCTMEIYSAPWLYSHTVLLAWVSTKHGPPLISVDPIWTLRCPVEIVKNTFMSFSIKWQAIECTDVM